MAVVAIQAAIFLFLICPSLLSWDQGLATSPSFFYNFSDPASFSQGDLYFEGDAYVVGDGSVLTNERLNGGRVSYRHPVRLWSKATGFSVSSSFVINDSVHQSQQNDNGGGLAFFLAPYTSSMPLNSGGAHLGLFNITTATGGEWFVAVDIDTHGDVGWDPIVSPHIGSMVIDNLGDGILMMVLQVDYSDVEKILNAKLQDFTNGKSMTLRMTADLRRFLPQEVAIGFSAARGFSERGLYRLLWWSFNTIDAQVGVSKRAAPVRAALEASGNSGVPSPVSGKIITC